MRQWSGVRVPGFTINIRTNDEVKKVPVGVVMVRIVASIMSISSFPSVGAQTAIPRVEVKDTYRLPFGRGNQQQILYVVSGRVYYP
jgi:hypothetical protein